MINVKLESVSVLKHMSEIEGNARKVEQYTVNDMRRAIPGIVSDGVCRIYQIKRSEVAQSQKNGKGRNSGKASVRTSFSGNTIASLAVSFTGRKHAKWPTKPKRPPKTRRFIKRGGRKYSVPRAYQVKVETYRGHPSIVKAKGKYRVFVLPGRGMPFVVGSSNRPMIKGSSSVPQAITHKKSMALWRPALNKKLETRFYHHFNRFMKK